MGGAAGGTACGRNAFPGEAQVAVGPTRGRRGFCVLPAPTHRSFCQPNASRRRVLSVTRPGNQCRVAVSFHSSQRFKELCFAGVPRGRRHLHPRHLGLRGACDPAPRPRSLPDASCALFIQPFLKNFPPSRHELETAERLETPQDRTAQRAHHGVCSFPTG